MSRYVRHDTILRISSRHRLAQIGACQADEVFRTRFWACRRKSDDRWARASSYFPCLYRWTVSLFKSARQKSSKKPVKKYTSHLKLPAFNSSMKKRIFVLWRRTRCSMHAQTKLMQISRSIRTHRYRFLFIDTINFLTVSKFSGALFFASTSNTRMEFQITNGACANVSNRIKEGELLRPASLGFD